MRNYLKTILLLTLGLVSFQINSVSAEMLLLKTGDIVEGTILSASNEKIIINLGHEKPTTYLLEDIESIDGVAPDKTKTPIKKQTAPAVKKQTNKPADAQSLNTLNLPIKNLLIMALLSHILWAIPLYVIANQLGEDRPWMAWIPIANYILMLRITQLSKKWMALLLLPFLPIPGGILLFQLAVMYFYIIFGVKISTIQEKPAWLGTLFFLPFVGVAVFWYLAFSQSTYNDEDIENDSD